jgi:lipopolysaccharide transport protein LptA
MTLAHSRLPIVLPWMAIFALWVAPLAHADFVDELPQLPLTPAPLPTGTATGRPDSGTLNSNPREGANAQAHSTPPAGAGTKEGVKPPAAVGSPAPGKDNKGGGLFGSDTVKHDSNAPIAWQGDELEGSLGKGILLLKNNVEIRQDDTLMKSDIAELYSKAGTTTPDRAIAKGRVSILKRPNPRVPEIRAVANEIEYFVQERRVILKGQPKIWRGKELLQGEVMELALDTGDIRIRSARSVVDPKNAQQGEKGSSSSPAKGMEKKK